MTIVRVLVWIGVVVVCGGFVPVSGCAKGCGRAGRSADDFAHSGASYTDDLARSSRYSGYTPGRPVGVPVVAGGGHVGDDLAHLSSGSLDNAIATLPEVEGAASSMARRPTSSGARLEGVDDPSRTFSRDYARSIDDLKLTKKQHEELVDSFEVIQDAAKEAVGQLVEAAAEDGDDVVDSRVKLQMAAMELEARLAETLTPEQREKFREVLGAPEVVAYRLGKEQPVKRKRKKDAADKK